VFPIGGYFPDKLDPQAPARVAVVTPTLMRGSIRAAVESVYRQDLGERIQLVVGADLNPTETAHLYEVLAARPDHVSAVVLTLPYSTSQRHGGVHPAWDGGALRTILSFMANARHVAYLDDDNVWTPDHLSSLLTAVEGRYWAHSLRLLLDEDTGEELGVDRWDAVGPGKGRFKDQGGMVDPNCLLVDKVLCAPALWLWSDPGTKFKRLEADRRLAATLARFPHGAVDRATVRYRIRPTSILREFLRDGAVF
jgi:hypothetical protein